MKHQVVGAPSEFTVPFKVAEFTPMFVAAPVTSTGGGKSVKDALETALAR